MAADTTIAGPESSGPATALRRSWALPRGVLGVLPFIGFAILFLILPTFYLLVSAFVDTKGGFTFGNIADLAQPKIINSLWLSIQLSVASAIIGCVAGLALALALIRGGLPAGIRSAVLTFSGVASNFAGVPLAFAFVATVGRVGLVTALLKLIGFDIYHAGFNLFAFWGLVATYCYFQIPLMVLIIAPAIDGLKKEWGEAASTLGATRSQFWFYVGFPVLWPNLLGTLSLLFANAFGAVATAFSLSGTQFNILPITLYSQIRGDALNNPGLGAAIAVLMVVLTGLTNVIYLWFRARAERWLK
jgi:putative spermidine/putrescine transport system permease protein